MYETLKEWFGEGEAELKMDDDLTEGRRRAACLHDKESRDQTSR